MLDLETRLRHQFEETVRDLEASERLDGLVHERRQRRIRRRRLAAGGLTAVGLVAVLAGAAAVLRGGDDGSAIVAGSSTEAGGDALFLVPGGALPEGFELLEASGGDRPGVGTETVASADWDDTQRWVRFDEAHEHPVEVIDIHWGHGPATGVAEDGWIVRQVAAGQADGPLLGVHGFVAPEQPGGPATPLPRDLLIQVLDGITPRPGGGFELPAAPEGFELVGEWPGVASDGTNPRVLAYGEPGRRGFQLQIVDDSELPPATSLDTAAARLVTVRGNPGVSTPHLFSRPSLFDQPSLFLATAHRFLQWVEPGGERVTLSALGMSDDEILAVANSLQGVDAETWFALQDGATPGPEPGSEPDVAASSSTSTTATSATGGEPVHIEGTYEGTEHYALATGRCDLNHVLDTTWAASDGSTWTFHQEYCGLLDGNVWTYGGGTFTLTAPDGATVTGDAQPHSAKGPTYNNPDSPGITLDIWDGSGRFDHATGQCILMNHVTQVTLGEQRQDGTFTCDFTI
jgi:hypothetical protein